MYYICISTFKSTWTFHITWDEKFDDLLTRSEIKSEGNRFNSDLFNDCFSATSYRITVHTGDVKDAGTQSNVSIMLFGEKGNSPKLRLDKSETYNTKFCRDQLDIFTVYNIPQLRDLHKVQIWHDMTGPKHEWFVKGFYVEDKSTRKVYFFNCNAWIGRDGDVQDIKCEGYTLPEGKPLRLGFAEGASAGIQYPRQEGSVSAFLFFLTL